jgi:ribosomal-protein-alanine N-acetyltransferase
MSRLLAPEEAPALADTHAAAFTQSRPWSAAEFRDLLEHRLTFGLGDGRCCALVRVIADEAVLLTIATHPAQQRQGLARQLMAGWQAEAKARGAAEAFLEGAADNAAALTLYQSCGFNVCGSRPKYYPREAGGAVDAHLMRRDLR